MTRSERRAKRQKRFVTAKEARLAARLAKLDYRVTDNGALKPPTKGRTWHLGNRLNGHAPPPGRDWDRSGPTYVVAVGEVRLPEPVIHERWRRLKHSG
jgi:hypothetical protein